MTQPLPLVAYLGALQDMGGESREVGTALRRAEEAQQRSGDAAYERSDERRRVVDEALHRANSAKDLIEKVRERTGAGEPPRQIASAGLAFPDWATAQEHLSACTSRLEQAETELEYAERALSRWHERRGARANWLVWLAAVVVGIVVIAVLLADLVVRFPFVSWATILLLLAGGAVVAVAGGVAAVLLKHPQATEGPPLRTRVRTEGLLRLCLRIGVPAFLVLLVIRIFAGIYLTIAGWFS